MVLFGVIQPEFKQAMCWDPTSLLAKTKHGQLCLDKWCQRQQQVDAHGWLDCGCSNDSLDHWVKQNYIIVIKKKQKSKTHNKKSSDVLCDASHKLKSPNRLGTICMKMYEEETAGHIDEKSLEVTLGSSLGRYPTTRILALSRERLSQQMARNCSNGIIPRQMLFPSKIGCSIAIVEYRAGPHGLNHF